MNTISTPAHSTGAFLGRIDLREAALARVRGRSHGPLPPARLSEICHAIANHNLLPLECEPNLGWPQDLLHLVDTLVMAQAAREGGDFLEALVGTALPGAELDNVVPAFLLQLLADPQRGVYRHCTDRVRSLIGAIAHQLEAWLSGGSLAIQDWEALKAGAHVLLGAVRNDGGDATQHYAALVARCAAELDAAQAARWAWQVAASADKISPAIAADAARTWQMSLIVDHVEAIATGSTIALPHAPAAHV
jgi:hypothetical protein